MLTDDAFIAGMPKAELHVHLEGTLERSMVEKLALRNGLKIEPAPSTIGYNDLTSFLAAYYSNMKVLLTEQDFYDLAFAYFVKAHAMNIVHAEVFFDPQAHTSRGVEFDAVLGGYHRAAVAASTQFGIEIGLIMCILRDHSVESAAATLDAALDHKEWIVGVGLDSDERDNPPSKFAEIFALARAQGYLLTMHCDPDQPAALENLRQVIEDIRVDRIDHGTNIVEDPRLVDAVRRAGLGLTSCPLSNALIGGGMKDVEILSLLRSGVKITINSDDPAYFGGYLTDNLIALASASDLTRAELVQLERNAFDVSWISADLRRGYQKALSDYVIENE